MPRTRPLSAQQLVLLLAVSLAVGGQLASRGLPGNRSLGCGAAEAYRTSPSPFVIVDRPSLLKDLWNTLEIPPKLRLASSGGFVAAPREIDCTTGCQAKIVGGDHLLPDGNDSIVRVCKENEITCRFLVLHQSSAGWKLVDYLDSPFEKYEAPRVWVQTAQDRRWLVKSGFGGGGTGLYLSIAEWFELHCGTLQPVLTLPFRGDDVNAKPARYFSTRFKAFHVEGSRDSLEFGYTVRFEDYPNQRQLWQEERTVVFSRAKRSGAFAFDPAASTISAAFEKKVFAIASMGENDFLEFAYNRLLRIAGDAAANGCVVFSQDARQPESSGRSPEPTRLRASCASQLSAITPHAVPPSYRSSAPQNSGYSARGNDSLARDACRC
jgi:hypothetical protein